MAGNDSKEVPFANRRSTVLGVVLPFALLSIISVTFRLYTRLFIVKSPGWDDALIVVALLCVVFGAIVICLSLDAGLGEHVADLPFEQFMAFLLRFYMSNGAYVMSTALTKLSLLLQYLRVYTGRTIRVICITLLVIIGIWGAANTFMGWFPCFPPRAYWNWDIPNPHCYAFGARKEQPFYDTYLSHGILNAVFDIAVFLCSLPMCLRNDRSKQEKTGIVCLLLLGSWIVTISLWRLATIVDHRAGWKPIMDFTWYGPSTIVLSSLEVFCGLIAASCPVFWPVIESGLNAIFVTQVIEVTSYDRRGGDDLELRLDVSRSPHGSQRSLRRKISINTLDYYQDSWVMDNVNPLKAEGEVTVEAQRRPSIGPV